MVDGHDRRRIREAARELLGHEELRPGQAEAGAAVLDGRDVLAVMPTGSGKSAIYQLGGALIDGLTVVVSPLIALQHDQVQGVDEDLGGAVLLNSTLSAAARAEVLERVAAGSVEFVLVAPEQLANPETLALLTEARPSLFVVDEAHCISTWGHDFRPEYRALADRCEALGRPQVLALTATAAPPVRADIVRQLRLVDPVVVVAGFDRPNIRLEVERVPDPAAAAEAVRARVAAEDGTGIVYVATRDDAEAVAAAVATAERPGLAYHAGLSASERTSVHERFTDEAPCVVAATTAFGMGIDVPHVRFVVHAEAPESLDSYLQEVGRAGRDGEPAVGVLVHALEGGGGRRFFAGIGAADPDAPPEEAAEREAAREVERTRRAMVDRYVGAGRCRWGVLLAYFGEPIDGGCGRCDVCDGGGEAVAAADGPFAVGTRVRHEEFGAGEVVEADEDEVVVLFDESGYRTLATAVVVERGLLAPG